MKARLNFCFVLVLMLMAVWATPLAFSQEMRRGGARFYNPSTETTIKGAVQQVETAYLPGGGAARQGRGEFGGPIYLELKTDSGTLRVFLGPPKFVESKGFKFAKGDQVEVTGSRFHEQTIIAREVKKNDQVLVLRNAQGIPEWSRGQ